MLKKRIIPCLDIKNGRAVKGVNFLGIRDAGDPVELARRYALEGADELVFLDIAATLENRATILDLVREVAAQINIPFTVGGGISSMADVRALLLAGADKISLNSAAIRNPGLIKEIASATGSQCVVVAIDTRHENGRWQVLSHGGQRLTNLQTVAWARKVEELGAGEILLTSMDRDGTHDGFACDITKEVCEAVNIPVIASGGAGTKEHFKTLFDETSATGALAASIFHYGSIGISDLKNYLYNQQIPIRL